MLRMPLTELCLQIKSLHLGDIKSFLLKVQHPSPQMPFFCVGWVGRRVSHIHGTFQVFCHNMSFIIVIYVLIAVLCQLCDIVFQSAHITLSIIILQAVEPPKEEAISSAIDLLFKVPFCFLSCKPAVC